jgi:hypothetical protein
LIEAKTMRMRGHAQHDSADYVPKEMLELWKRRDPLDLYEKFLNGNRFWDAKIKKEIDARIAREIQADVEFAENSPFPPPELAAQGVYCEGCHTVEADWKRPKEEVMPPRSSVRAKWPVKRAVRTEAPPTPAAKAATTGSHHNGRSGNGARPSAASNATAKSRSVKKPPRVPAKTKARP